MNIVQEQCHAQKVCCRADTFLSKRSSAISYSG